MADPKTRPADDRADDFDPVGDDVVELEPEAPAPKPAAEVPERPPAPPKKSRLAALAESYGYDVSAMSPEEIEIAVEGVGRWLAREREAVHRENAVREAVDRKPAPAPEPPPEPDDALGIDEAQYPAEIVDLFKRQQKTIRELQGQLGGVQKGIADDRNRTLADVIDEAFEELGPEFEAVFGKGTRNDIGVDSPEFRRRNAAVAQTRLDLSKPHSNRQVKRAVADAARLLFGPAAKPAAPAPAADAGPYGPGTAQPAPADRPTRERDPETGKFLTDQEIEARRWVAGQVQVPTHRNGSREPVGVARATKNLTDRMRDLGAVGENGEAQLDDFLP